LFNKPKWANFTFSTNLMISMPRKWAIPAILSLLLLLWFFSLPSQMFSGQYSTVMYDKDGRLLNARVAADGQWRFPESNVIPEKYRIALLTFEDRYYSWHPGFNPFSMVRALVNNTRPGRVKSGASTITMQVIRLSRHGRPRTIGEKITEVWLATRLELRYSKKSILRLYASHAPFGGNVVGLQAASWRYFGHAQEDLSWAEAATLAVLPNSPALIFPGRNQQLLLQKRNGLLNTLHQRGYLDQMELQLAIAEPLPGRPHPLPQHAPQLFNRAMADGLDATQIFTTIDTDLQQRIGSILLRHHDALKGNHIHNIAALVARVSTGEVLAYWGNTPQTTWEVNAAQVDVIAARRSPGSLLKPFLYAGLLQEGQILPNSLVPDIPTHFQGFSPENFARTYDGAVPASRALARSLNIPAVRMLMDYHPDRFLATLRDCGLYTLDKPASHYGLSLILGGGEVTMWDITGAYASMARTLKEYEYDNPDQKKTFFPLNYQISPVNTNYAPSPFGAGVMWHTFEAMVEAARPDTETNWHFFGGSRRVAWKTGTSYGNRDAWSIGINPEYVVAVWAGNATGEGRPMLTGIGAAAPVMFDIFGTLPHQPWFTPPYEDLKPLVVCHMSGYPASDFCTLTETIQVPNLEQETGPCPYHKIIHMDRSTGLRVNSNCASLAEMEAHNWFVLPPVQEYYFRQKNPFYQTLPAFKPGCGEHTTTANPMQWIYPIDAVTIFIPVELDGLPGETVFRVAHRHDNTRVHWHLNGIYTGSTLHFHEMAFRPHPGRHTFVLTDDQGNFLEKEIEIRMRNR
jgi:penicillin-binding protein 1C